MWQSACHSVVCQSFHSHTHPCISPLLYNLSCHSSSAVCVSFANICFVVSQVILSFYFQDFLGSHLSDLLVEPPGSSCSSLVYGFESCPSTSQRERHLAVSKSPSASLHKTPSGLRIPRDPHHYCSVDCVSS